MEMFFFIPSTKPKWRTFQDVFISGEPSKLCCVRKQPEPPETQWQTTNNASVFISWLPSPLSFILIFKMQGLFSWWKLQAKPTSLINCSLINITKCIYYQRDRIWPVMRDFLVDWFCFTDVTYTVIPTEKERRRKLFSECLLRVRWVADSTDSDIYLTPTKDPWREWYADQPEAPSWWVVKQGQNACVWPPRIMF